MIQKTEGIILRCQDFTETSQLVTLFTRDFGKVTVIAKGSRRVNSKKFTGKLDLFNQAELVFYRSHKGELHILSECHILNIFFDIRLDLNRMALAAYMMELLNVSVGLEDKHIELYDFAVNSLDWLNKGNDVKLARYIFEIKLLSILGLFPQMKFCSQCHRIIEDTAVLSMPAGWLCQRCNRGRRCLTKGGFALIKNIVLSKRPQLIKIHCLQLEEIKGITRLIIDYNIDKRLKSLDFLERVNYGQDKPEK